MRTNEIEKHRTQQPFVPFRICYSDVVSYEVRHPEMLIVSKNVLAVALYEPDSSAPDSIILCDPVHVVRLEPLDNGSAKGKPAKRKPRRRNGE
jgi:hypothetical protein